MDVKESSFVEPIFAILPNVNVYGGETIVLDVENLTTRVIIRVLAN